jgi:uncharacterized protein YjiS (DUF1127 family)
MEAIMQALALKTVQFPALSLNMVATWARRFQTRAALAKLDNAALEDIGMSYRQAFKEANKPFWL